MIENGEIVQSGTYEELIKNEGLFNNFMKNYLNKNEPENKKTGNVFK